MREPARRRSTATSSFGVSRRESHDSSAFYERFIPPVINDDKEVSPSKAIDGVFVGDSRAMDAIADKSVALVVTSPPYFAGKDYEKELGEGHVPASYADYLTMLEEVFAECVRTLEPGGRIAVNVANLGRKPYRSLAADVTWILQDRLRLLLRGEVVWVKAKGATGSCAWGSFQQPGNPVLRDLTERVVIAGKGRFDRALKRPVRAKNDLPSTASITRDEFMEATTDVWEIPPESASRVGHPAPFPVELPERLIHLYTYEGDLVLDPFMGSGTTAVAAVRTGRHFAGYDTDPDYVAEARRRVDSERTRLSRLPGPDFGPFDIAIDGRSAGAVARDVIEQCGFVDIDENVSVAPGAVVSFVASDATGERWCLDVAGGFTSNRPGLRRADALWKAIAKAALLAANGAGPYVVLTPSAPAKGANDTALRSVTGLGLPIRDVVVLTSGDDISRLRTHALG